MNLQKRYGWIGVDLGSHAIKLAQLERVGSRMRLLHARVVLKSEVAPGNRESDGSWWREAFTEDLASEFRGKQAACVISSATAHTHLLAVPAGTWSERRGMIEGELASIYSSSDRPRVFDFWDTEVGSGGVETTDDNVAVATITEDEAYGVDALITGAGWTCQVLEPPTLTLAHATALSLTDEVAGCQAVIDWGYHYGAFAILSHGRPVFVRALRDCGYGRVLAAIRSALSIGEEDARVLLTTCGLPAAGDRDAASQQVQEVLGNVIAPAVQALVSEVQKTLHYLNSHRRRHVPVRLVLFGGGATIRNVAQYIEHRVDLPALAWPAPAGAQTWPLVESAPMFAQAVALSALRWQS